MKFNKEDAVEKLNKALTNDGKKPLRLSKRTLESQTENLMSLIANDDMELDDFVGKILPMVASANSNAEHDQSEFVRKYQEDHKNPEPPKPSTPSGATDPATQALIDRIAAMEKKEQEREQAISLANKKAEISKYLSDNNVKDAGWIDKVLSVTTVSFDEDVEAKGKSLLEIYNMSHSAQDVFTPVSPSAGGGSDADPFAELKAVRQGRTSPEA